MQQLGSGLGASGHHEDALTVREALLALTRRIGASACEILTVQGNLANTYQNLGRLEPAARMRQEVYSRKLELHGEEHVETLRAANNYASLLIQLKRFEEAKSLVRKILPVARRVLGDSNDTTLRMRWNYAVALYLDHAATLDDLREAVTTLEDAGRIARRVLGGAHPVTESIKGNLQDAQATLRAREATSK